MKEFSLSITFPFIEEPLHVQTLPFTAREAYISNAETGQKLTADSVVFSYQLKSGEEAVV